MKTSEYLEELYPAAIDVGIPIELFWNSSVNEITDMLDSHSRKTERKRKQKIMDDFLLAEVIAHNMATMLFSENDKKPMEMPWDYYPSLFEKEKEIYEEKLRQIEFEEYKERRREYIAEFNRRRQQGN